MTLSWPTVGTRQCLSGSVESVAQNAHSHGHRVQVLIGSESESATTQASIRDMLSSAARRWGATGTVSYPAQTRLFATSLAADVDPKLIAWALTTDHSAPLAPGPGAQRNIILLETADSPVIMTDDDAFAQTALLSTSPANRFRPVFSSRYLPADVLFVSSRAEALAAVVSADVDLVSRHMDVFGPTHGRWSDLPGLPADRPVLVSTAGAYGDSAMGNSRSLLTLDDAVRDLAFANYAAIRTSREIVRIPERLAVGTGTQLMTVHVGLDNRELLCPFFPLGRNEDGLFSVTTRIVYPEEVRAFQPYGLLHDPEDERTAGDGDLHEFMPPPADLVMQLVVACAPRPDIRGPADRMRALGAGLVEISSFPVSDFASILQDAWARSAMSYADRLGALLQKFDRQPEIWAADVDSLIATIHDLLHDPRRLFGATGCGLSVEDLRYHTSRFGSLLSVWPHLWEFMKGREPRAVRLSVDPSI